MTEERVKRKLSAILSADVAGYSRLMGEDEVSTVRTLEAYRKVMSDLIEQFRGRVVDSPGDNLLAEFGSVVDAVQCAVEIQQVIKAKNGDLPESRRMQFRVGINLGDVIEEGGRIYGDGVNLAARIEGLSDPGNICISGSAYEQIKSKLALGYQDLGKKTVKNIAEPIRVYRIPIDSEPLTAGSQKTAKPIRLKWPLFFVIAGIVLGVGSILIWNNYLKPSLTQEAVRQSAAERLKAHIDKPTEGTRPDAEFLSDLDKTIEQVETQVRERVETELRNALERFEDNLGDDRQTNTLIEAAKKDTPAVPMGKPSIAVLPFDNLSSDPEQDYFVEGLSEEILNSLAQISDLTVIAKTSSFSFKGSNKTIQEIASVLGVDHILDGSVRKAGNVLRITAQLVKAADGSHLWSKTYDRELKVREIFAVQEDIATAVANELKLKLGIGKLLQQLGGTDNLEAYELYLVALGENSSIRRIELLDEAIALDPEFANAWALKANAHWLRSVFGPANRLAAEQDAGLNAALRAIELEPQSGAGYSILASIKVGKGDWTTGESAYRKALELPTETFWPGKTQMGIHYMAVGHFKKAHKILEEAVRNDPLAKPLRAFYVLSFAFLDEMQRAEEEYEHSRELFGGQWPIGDLLITIKRLVAGDSLSLDKIVYSDRIFDAAKNHLDSPKEGLAEMRRVFTNEDNLSSEQFTSISIWAAYFMDPEFAMDAMEKGVSISASSLFRIWFPVMREVRKTSRFKEFVREIGLIDYWKEYGWPDTNMCRPVGDDDFVCD